MSPFRALTFSLLAALAARSTAASLTFDYKDPKEISAVSLSIDSMLEPIVGYAKGISGTVSFDPLRPERSSGRLAVDVSSIVFSNEGYTQTAKGYALNEKKYPQLLLTIRKVSKVKALGNGKFVGEVLADFTCRGITKPKLLTVSASYLPGRAEERTNGQHKGDLLILRTKFAVSRTEHGISSGIPDEMVGDRIDVGVSVVGIHYAAPKPTARWEIEVGHRDDPELVQAERVGDRLSFRSSGGTLGAKIVDEKGGKVRFRLDPNPSLGEAAGEIDAQGFGKLQTKDGAVGLRGRRVETFSPMTNPDPTGTGFATLGIPNRMKAAKAAGLAIAQIRNDQVTEVGLYGTRKAGGKEPVVRRPCSNAEAWGGPCCT